MRVTPIKEIKRISKPGRRVYSRATSIPKVMNGLGLAILSTPKGVMSDSELEKIMQVEKLFVGYFNVKNW